MPVPTKIDPLSRDLAILIDETLSPAAQSRAFADFALAELREAQIINRQALGSVPPHDTFVDGRLNAPLESVDADGGRIIFEFEILVDVLVYVAEMLYAKSPVKTGAYRSAHKLFADGVEVERPEQAPPASEYVFLNPLPYARKIEAGKMQMSVAGSDHVYEQARQAAARRYSNIAAIGFTYRALAGSDRVPAITIKPR
jgi:hypothetical protein